MKTSVRVVATVLFAVVMVTPVFAQQRGTGTDPHRPAPSTDPSATPTPAPSTGPKGGDMPMMDMCRQMMGGDMMGMPMMGGGAPTGPKERADMLQMRGEMMKAMGDIMMKHARRMHGAAGK
jgi:hypothetical protein